MHFYTVLFKPLPRIVGTAGLIVLFSPLFAQDVARPRFTNHFVEEVNSSPANDGAVTRMAAPMAAPSNLLIPREPPAGMMTPAQKAVKDAERYFQYGKFFLQEGKREEARREFDKAVDVLLDVPENVADRRVAERKFEELIRLIYRYDVDGLDAGVAQDSPVFTQSPLAEILELTFPVDPNLKDRTLSHVQASVSQLPLAVNDAVLSYINYFTSERGRRTLLAGLRRSGRYREMIHRVFAEEGVPQELIHLAQAESGFQPMAVSHKAAVGMWQFIAFTGAQYGLNRSVVHDFRLDPERSTRAAARHLRDLYNQTGDWHLAMAAYNCGPACVERAVQRTGYADFWELRRRNALPRETMNYVPAILAMTIVSKNLSYYGLPEPEYEPALEFENLEVSAPTSLALIADGADVPPSVIREMNPALLKGHAPAGFEVHVPKDKRGAIAAALEAVPEANRSSWRLHRVSSGDTLASISRLYSTGPGQIMAANSRLDGKFFDAPEDGEVLLIPARVKPEPVRQTASAKSKSTHKSTAHAARAHHPAPKRVAAKRPAPVTTARR